MEPIIIMPAAATDYFLKVTPAFSTTIGSGGVANGGVTTIPLTAVTDLPTDTGIELTINRVDSDGNETNSYETVRGVVSGSNLTNCVRGVEGTASAWDAGTVVEYLVTADIQNRMVTGVLVEHNQDGTHSDITSDTLTTTGDVTVGGDINVSDGQSIKDGNDNELIRFQQTASAVNQIDVTNAATGNGPIIESTGGDTNIDLNLQAKGTGAYNLKGTASSAAEVRFFEDTDNGNNYVGLKAPASVGSSETFVLPDADGTTGQFIKTDGSGNLSFDDPPGSSTLTRRLWIHPTRWMAETGSPTRSVDATDHSVTWLLDAAATEVIMSEFEPLPADYDSGNLTFKSYWAMVSATSGNVVIDLQYKFIADTESITGITSIGNATVAVPGTADTLKVYTHSSSITGMAPGDLMGFRFIRTGGDGSDTASGDLQFLGLEVSYTASS